MQLYIIGVCGAQIKLCTNEAGVRRANLYMWEKVEKYKGGGGNHLFPLKPQKWIIN